MVVDKEIEDPPPENCMMWLDVKSNYKWGKKSPAASIVMRSVHVQDS